MPQYEIQVYSADHVLILATSSRVSQALYKFAWQNFAVLQPKISLRSVFLYYARTPCIKILGSLQRQAFADDVHRSKQLVHECITTCLERARARGFVELLIPESSILDWVARQSDDSRALLLPPPHVIFTPAAAIVQQAKLLTDSRTLADTCEYADQPAVGLYFLQLYSAKFDIQFT